MISCLWVSGLCPYPADSGGLMYSRRMAEALAATGAEVCAICLATQSCRPEGAPTMWRMIKGRRRHPAESLLSRLPNTSHSLATPEMARAVRRAMGERAWTAVVIDHLQAAWSLPIVAGAATQVGNRPVLVYVSQNHESSTRHDIAARYPGRSLRRTAFGADAGKAERLEKRVSRQADLITAVTSQDAERFERDAGPMTAVTVLPPGYSGGRVGGRRIGAHVPRRAVVLTSLRWHVKQSNLESFLAVADPLFDQARAEILVVGDAPPSYVGRLAPRLRATTFAGRVADLTTTLAQARVGVVSEPLGGGFKLKCLDYIFNRVPMAVTRGSAAGLPLGAGEDYLCFADETSLARGVLAVLDDFELLNRLQNRAFAGAAHRFDWAGRGEELATAIEAAARMQVGRRRA